MSICYLFLRGLQLQLIYCQNNSFGVTAKFLRTVFHVGILTAFFAALILLRGNPSESVSEKVLQSLRSGPPGQT